MSEYTEQAEKFCKDTGTTIVFELLQAFKDDALKPVKVAGVSYPLYRDKFNVKITRKTKEFTRMESFEFTNSAYVSKPGIKGNYKRPQPKAYDILACLEKNGADSFKEFCSNFGYDEDSRKALNTYLLVQEEYQKVLGLFHDVMEQLQEIN